MATHAKTGPAQIRANLDSALKALASGAFPRLRFPEILEDAFEADTRQARAYRMWVEGLVAIVAFNLCLVIDYAVVRDLAWLAVVRQTANVTPLALATNLLVRQNPKPWLREGCVALSMITICWFNLRVVGNHTAASTLFGTIGVLITALFVGVVMRLRSTYAAVCIGVMLTSGILSLAGSTGLSLEEKAVGSSMLCIGLSLIAVASYSLEREERKSYLLSLQRNLESEDLTFANEVLQRLSGLDKLTGLPNRRALEERIESLWETCASNRTPLSMVLIDVDNFKIINDVYGHLYGDEALRRMGILLPQVLRSADDMAARFGGEEFVLLLAHTSARNAMIVAERARQLIEKVGTPVKPAASDEALMWITISCGVSSCMPAPGFTWTALIAAADEALYAAKRGGRNRLEFRNCIEPQPDGVGLDEDTFRLF
jgi:diguanylate cyclase (GGDEF)-like protein